MKQLLKNDAVRMKKTAKQWNETRMTIKNLCHQIQTTV